MGCVSSSPVDDGLPDQAGPPTCSVCGESAARPLRKLRREEREAWVAVKGETCHRKCAVARKLEAARQAKANKDYARAKHEVYPSPSSLLEEHHGHKLHQVPSGQEWAHSESFCEPWDPPSPLAALDQRNRQLSAQLEATTAGSQQQDSQLPSPASEQQQPEEEQGLGGEQQGAAPAGGEGARGAEEMGQDGAGKSGRGDASPRAVISALSSSTQPSFSSGGGSLEVGGKLGGSSSIGAGSDAAGAPGQRQLLRRPSPVHHPALLEAKVHRRLTARPSFDGEALRADPDGGDGKAWREGCKKAVEEARKKAAREAAMKADCNGF